MILILRAPAAPVNTDFTADFSVDRNPTDASIYVLGGTNGLKWQNPRVLGGNEFGNGFDGATGASFDDNICHVKTSVRAFSADQFCELTAFRDPAYSPVAGTDHESEGLLRFSISENDARGYELIYGVDGSLVLVRWNGPFGSFSELITSGGVVGGAAATGDLIYFAIKGFIVTAKKNGVNIPNINGYDLRTFDGGTINSGQPGRGYFVVNNGTAVLSKFCWKGFRAGDVP